MTNTKLFDLYWDYLKKIYTVTYSNATTYAVALETSKLDILSSETMLSKAILLRPPIVHNRVLTVRSAESAVNSDTMLLAEE